MSIKIRDNKKKKKQRIYVFHSDYLKLHRYNVNLMIQGVVNLADTFERG